MYCTGHGGTGVAQVCPEGPCYVKILGGIKSGKWRYKRVRLHDVGTILNADPYSPSGSMSSLVYNREQQK